MTVSTFEKLINIFTKAFTNFKFNLKDSLMVEVWYNELAYMEESKAILAVKKVISSCDFVTIKSIKQAYAEIDNPQKVDDTEGWGLVERSIRLYGYPRAAEAMESLPIQVQRAVQHMGGFQSICEAENKEVVRGQFNRAMAAINDRIKVNATLGQPLLTQIMEYQFLAEKQEMDKINLHTGHTSLEYKEITIEDNKTQVEHIRDVFKRSLEAREACGI